MPIMIAFHRNSTHSVSGFQFAIYLQQLKSLIVQPTNPMQAANTLFKVAALLSALTLSPVDAEDSPDAKWLWENDAEAFVRSMSLFSRASAPMTRTKRAPATSTRRHSTVKYAV